MRKLILTIIFLSFSSSVLATISNCSNLYVGRINHYQQQGVHSFTLVEDPSQTNGSQWINLNNWQDAQKKEIVSTLLSAKLANKLVFVETVADDGSDRGCKINEAGRTLYRLILQQGEY